ncbi:MAG: DUF5615 family PIN-like protein [Bryobacteraceae bacterium]
MKLLIDECLPRALKTLFVGHECRTVQELGWSGKKNGHLLSVAEPEFDVLVTIDQGIQHQQNLAGRRIAILVLGAQSNQIEDLAPLIPTALAALRSIAPGRVATVRA